MITSIKKQRRIWSDDGGIKKKQWDETYMNLNLKIRGLPNFEFQGGSRHTISRFGGLFYVWVCPFVWIMLCVCNKNIKQSGNRIYRHFWHLFAIKYLWSHFVLLCHLLHMPHTNYMRSSCRLSTVEFSGSIKNRSNWERESEWISWKRRNRYKPLFFLDLDGF